MGKKSLIRSILLSSAGVLTAALIAVCVIYSVCVNVQYTKSIKSDLYNAVSVESEKMNGWFDVHIALAEDLAAAAVEQDLHGEELQGFLLNVTMATSPSIMNNYLAWESETEPGSMVCGVYPVGDTYVAQSRGWYQTTKQTMQTIVTAPYIDAITGAMVMTVAAPLIDHGRFVGSCGLDVEIGDLIEMTQNLKADENGYAILVDSDDNVVAHAKHKEYSHHLIKADEEYVIALADVDPVFAGVLAAADSKDIASGKIDGNRYFFPAVSIGETGWKVLYAADYSDATKPLTNIILLTIIVSAAAIVCGALFFYIKYTSRLKPLSEIERVVTDMSMGVLDHHFPDTRNDEIGSICDSLKKTNSSLKTYINEIGYILSQMAKGNFKYSSSVAFNGEFTAVQTSIQNICEALRNTFSQLGGAADQIYSGSQSVSRGASDIANAVEDQTRLISDVSTNLEDINERVANSSENAFNVKKRSQTANKTVLDSNQKMQDMLQIMHSISESATEIVKINSTIEDIAFQTNILALNASIEAARAGAAGKGFAVVAEEVRNLASKSSEASSNTSRLIEQTVQTIKDGMEAANETASMLDEVVVETSSISDSVAQIADVSEEQKRMLAEIVVKLEEVSKVIQTTAQTSHSSATTSEQLDSQVETLRRSLEAYKV